MRFHAVKTASLLGCFALSWACGRGPGQGGGVAPRQGPPSAETRALRDVLGSTLERLGLEPREHELFAAELRTEEDRRSNESDSSQSTESSLLDPELVEMREGLIAWVHDSPGMLTTAKKDIAALKDEIAPVMAAGFAVEGRDAAQLKALIDLAVESPSPEIAAGIAGVAATHGEVWLRRYAAWALAGLATTAGTDRVVPLLLRRLKYERDPEVLVWVCSTLAAFDNYAGTGRLTDMSALPPGDAAGEAARGQLGVVLQRGREALGLPEAPDMNSAAIAAAWNEGRLGRPRSDVSDGLLGEFWLLVADLSGEHFQLRGVDDGRHVLSLLGPWAAAELSLALEDDDEYVRLHSAQVLERMGPRGQAAASSLMASLRDPHGAVCGAAAAALVAVTRGTEQAQAARAALLERLRGACPYELKVACVRALSRMGPGLIPATELVELFESTPLSDLRLAAAPGLLRGGGEGLVLPWLLDELENVAGDPAGAEAALGQWLESSETEAARASLEGWRDLAAPMSIVHTRAQASARRTARAAALRKALLP